MMKEMIKKITEAETYTDARMAMIEVMNRSIEIADVQRSAEILRDALTALLNVAIRTGQPGNKIAELKARITRTENLILN